MRFNAFDKPESAPNPEVLNAEARKMPARLADKSAGDPALTEAADASASKHKVVSTAAYGRFEGPI